jgi:DNA (cytosine-5)-methyltransferase 1
MPQQVIRAEEFLDKPREDLLKFSSEGKALLSHWISDDERNGTGHGEINKIFPRETSEWKKVLERADVNGSIISSDIEFIRRVEKFYKDAPQRPSRSGRSRFRFTDLFAGIGAFRMALDSLGGDCVFSSEIDSYARDTYCHNFGDYPFGDITKFTDFKKASAVGAPGKPANVRSKLLKKVMRPGKTPVILCGGFPCQSFSCIGRGHGLRDSGRGDMYKQVTKILEHTRPAGFILENVATLLTHDGGKSFETIKDALETLDYSFDYFKFSATDFGLPQNRKRVVLLGVDLKKHDRPEFDFKAMLDRYKNSPDYKEKKIWEVLGVSQKIYKESKYKNHRGVVRENPAIAFTLRCGGALSPLKSRHNWDGYKIGEKTHRLQPKECLELMGFPGRFDFPAKCGDGMTPLSHTRKKLQAGNSAPYPAIKTLARELIGKLGVKTE